MTAEANLLKGSEAIEKERREEEMPLISSSGS